ncbi:GDSL-type esterase/lipase family protein [Bacillus sp. 1P02SD]|uniref:SGNH/GDSL hydrolase family protein n=1 Tax=Bacillus sp. 1P02SD TaxID=3132264 RepID=UPI0039A3E3B8
MQKLIRRSRSLLIMLVVMLAFSPLSVLAEGENVNTINYVALGDSLAEGMLSDNSFGTGYVGMIKDNLETNGYKVNVHNAGYRGFTTVDVLAGVPNIPELAKADVITISAGANDILAVLQPVLGLQQVAQAAAGAAESAKAAASKALSEEELSVNEVQSAVAKVEESVISAAGKIESIFPILPPDQKAKLDSAFGLIQEAKTSVNKTGVSMDAAREAFDTNDQEAIGNLEVAVSNLDVVVQKLNSLIELIESLNIPIPIQEVLEVKDKAKDGNGAANSAKSKVESAKLAVKTYTEAQVKAEAAQFAATTATAEAVGVRIPEVLKEVGANTAQILALIRSVNPTAKIYVMGYYNALPYLPAEVQESMTKPMLVGLNAAINAPTSGFGATFVPVAHLFEGKHLEYLPNPANIHPSEAGYKALASAFMVEINKAFPAIEQKIDLGQEVFVNSGQLIIINETNVSLLLPDNLPEGTKLTVTNTSEDTLLKAEESNLKSFGDALNFEFKFPEGSEDYEGTFTLLMGYNADSPDNIAIYHFNEVDGKWEIQQGEKNKELHAISLDVTHFSNYGVFAQVEKQTPPVTKDPVDDSEDDGGTPPPIAEDPSKGPKDDGKKDTKKDTSKGKLPKTATNYYNLLLIGASLFMSGVIVFIFTKRRHLVMEK